jgi:hypothetical protein
MGEVTNDRTATVSDATYQVAPATAPPAKSSGVSPGSFSPSESMSYSASINHSIALATAMENLTGRGSSRLSDAELWRAWDLLVDAGTTELGLADAQTAVAWNAGDDVAAANKEMFAIQSRSGHAVELKTAQQGALVKAYAFTIEAQKEADAWMRLADEHRGDKAIAARYNDARIDLNQSKQYLANSKNPNKLLADEIFQIGEESNALVAAMTILANPPPEVPHRVLEDARNLLGQALTTPLGRAEWQKANTLRAHDVCGERAGDKSELLSKVKKAADAEVRAWERLVENLPGTEVYVHFYKEALNYQAAAEAELRNAELPNSE